MLVTATATAADQVASDEAYARQLFEMEYRVYQEAQARAAAQAERERIAEDDRRRRYVTLCDARTSRVRRRWLW
jgi:hypothetical protein